MKNRTLYLDMVLFVEVPAFAIFLAAYRNLSADVRFLGLISILCIHVFIWAVDEIIDAIKSSE